MTVDHVVPKRLGGSDDWDNLACACEQCNNKKGNRTPEEAGMRLRRAPKRPTYLTFMRQQVRQEDEIWKKYLFYSN
jgi:5-methylcytosine-specific restriction endonuclease McrA